MTAQVRKSSFDDPLIASTYSSTVLLKSLQLVWRRKKWPMLSLAYMPTSQLMKDASGNVIENVYYALTGTAVYSYSVKKVRMSSSVIYSQFYNRGTDSGFVLYNAKSIMYTHQTFLVGELADRCPVYRANVPGLLDVAAGNQYPHRQDCHGWRKPEE